ncbi:AbiU2 domain-containing protein [Calditrichota bacterium GD2]
MENPEKQLKEYLEKLIFRFIYIHSLHKQVLLILEWERPDRIIALQIGSYFFELTLFSFRRTIILELCKLLSEREDKSLLDWLKKAKKNAKALKPSVYSPGIKTSDSRRILKPYEYIEIIEKQISNIHKYDSIIQTLITRRDKDIAHSDRTYFNEPKKLHDLFPISDLDISSLLNTISEILRRHYSLLFHADITLDVSSTSNVDTVLTYIRAFDRVWHDKRLTRDFGIRVVEYKQDSTDQY